MTKQEALREAANKIEGGESGYCWVQTESCNCGVLAQVVLGIDHSQMLEILENEFANWGTWAAMMQGAWCHISGMNKNTAMSAMRRIGMSDKEVIELENLSNWDICRGGGIPFDERFSFNELRLNPVHVIRYMRAWADMLDEQSEITASAPMEDVAFRPTNTEREKHNVSI